MNFLKLVNEILLLEDPDTAVFKNDKLRYFDRSGVVFFVANVDFKNPPSSEPALFWGKEPGMMHTDLADAIMKDVWEITMPNLILPEWKWDCYPRSIKNQMKKSVENWKPSKRASDEKLFREAPYNINTPRKLKSWKLPSGRFWIKDENFLVSLWKGNDEEVKKWLNKLLPVWNPNNYPVFYQPPGAEDDEWVDGNEFLKTTSKTNSSEDSPEVIKLQKELNKLLPQIHIKTGVEKERIKNQIRNLQNLIKSQGGKNYGFEDNITSKGSYKASQIAGKMPIAQMRALSQTSESFNDF